MDLISVYFKEKMVIVIKMIITLLYSLNVYTSNHTNLNHMIEQSLKRSFAILQRLLSQSCFAYFVLDQLN